MQSLFAPQTSAEPSTFRLYIPGRPRAWQRTNTSKTGHRFTPPEMREYQKRIRDRAKFAFRGEPWTGLLEATVWIALPLLKGGGETAQCGDADNYAKGVFDALQGVVYENDKQLWPLTIRRAAGSATGEAWVLVKRSPYRDRFDERPSWGR